MRTFVISTMALGGSARALANLANHVAARGDEVEILTLHGGDDAYALHRAVRRRDLGFRGGPPRCSSESLRAVVATAARFPQALQLAADAETCAALRDVLAEEPHEAVVGVGDATSVRVIMATRGLGVRAVGWEQTDPTAYGTAWHVARHFVYPLADALVVLMPEHAQAFPGARCVAIPNAAVPAAGERGRGTGDRKIVGLGRLSWEKGFDILIEAFARIAERNPAWTLEIYGEGGQRAALQVLVARRGLHQRVLLPGTTRDTWGVLARADLFVVASYAEGFPNALLEAMAAGVAPVVVSCGAAVASIVRDGVDGLRVPRNAESLAAAMERLMRDDEERARLASRAVEVVERFSIERIAAQWDDVLTCHPERSEGSPAVGGSFAVGACPERAKRVERAAQDDTVIALEVA